MRRSLIAGLSALVLGLAACGGNGGDQTAETTATQPPAQTAEPDQATEPRGGADVQSESDLVQETEALVTQVAGAAQRLVEDPSADVDAELQRARHQAEELAALARERGDEAGAAAGDLAEQGNAELSPEQRQQLNQRLATINEQTAETAERLRRVTDPQVAARIAREDLRGLTDDLRAAADVVSEALPPEVRDRVDELRDRLGGLQR